MNDPVASSRLRVLVAIANHGTRNEQFLRTLLTEYRAMDFDVDVVVLSDRPKDLGEDVDVHVGAPSKDPWSLPFAHRAVFADRAADYDLFVYSEDDTLITQHHLEAFLEMSAVLPEDEVAGFLRYELTESGERSYASIHSTYRWLPRSVVRRGNDVFASFSNPHSACYVLTRAQLEHAIASGGFLVPPHRKDEYDLLVSAATDPYTQCGLTRRICVSRIDDFLLHHLPDAYLGRLGVSEAEFRAQISALLDIASGDRTGESLVDPASRLPTNAWDVPSHPTDATALRTMLAGAPDRALSVGCTSGQLERALLGESCAITAIPLDEVLAAVARTRGVVTTSPNVPSAVGQLTGQRFPLVLINDILHHVADPPALLRSLAPLVEPGGTILVSVPNVAFAHAKRRLGRPTPPVPEHGFAVDGVHASRARDVQRWFAEAGLSQPRIRHHNGGRGRALARLAPRQLGRTVLAVGGPPERGHAEHRQRRHTSGGDRVPAS